VRFWVRSSPKIKNFAGYWFAQWHRYICRPLPESK
jgi:hypothetical protein